jgi:hypothetical protein
LARQPAAVSAERVAEDREQNPDRPALRLAALDQH